MRQGEVAPTGKWVGNPLGGVKAPDALILPDPTTRFAQSAARLEALSDRPSDASNGCASWLTSRTLSTSSRLRSNLSPIWNRSASIGRWPRAHRRSLRTSIGATRLGAMASRCCSMFATAGRCRRRQRRSMASLRDRGAEAVEVLADDFLNGNVKPADAGAALYIAAARRSTSRV